MMSELPEFAEEYSFHERVRMLVRCLVIGGTFILLWKLWLLPTFTAFAATAQCRSVFGVPGTDVLWYGLFVVFPLFLALVFGFIEGRHGLKILRDGQSPPIAAKVLRPTRIKRGPAARRAGYLYALAFMPFVGIAIWGYFQAASLSRMSHSKHPVCTANHSFKADGFVAA
ncbi:hypothetical protein IHE49_01300 [Rhodanobacter sp. 7MK24]|uniref:hypothetical protein n=1 Tax=Rhodanobacter sp. 7MK24 TaxID=2775922 RepID=UPI001783F6BB|nr:hypothetical protein [Rhodanobacter sp. 7MK24]MBD8879112.1 hypothetical protein [Rhodanobacter sp. 7MK24]